MQSPTPPVAPLLLSCHALRELHLLVPRTWKVPRCLVVVSGHCFWFVFGTPMCYTVSSLVLDTLFEIAGNFSGNMIFEIEI